MSYAPLSTASGASNFQAVFDAALNNYKKKTKKDLLAHHLTAQLQHCESPSAILDVLNRQYDVQQFVQSQNDGQRSKQWLNATVNILCGFSAALGEGVGTVISRGHFINDLPINTQSAGVLTRKSSFCWYRRLPRGA